MVELLSKIPEAAFIFLIFAVASYLVGVFLSKISGKYEGNVSEVFLLISNSQKTLLIIIGVIVAVQRLGVDISALIAGLGLTGFALGLALKDAISNLVAGVMIVIYRPFEVGDDIDLSGSSGVVADMNLRHVTIKTEEGMFLIPNSLFLNTKLFIKSPAKEKS